MKNVSNLSITTRLTLFYTAATVILLSMGASFLYRSTTHILNAAYHQFVSDEIRTLQYLLKNEPTNNIPGLKQEIRDIPIVLKRSVFRYYIRILDSDGTLLVETPGAPNALAGASFFSISSYPSTKEKEWRSNNGTRYLLLKTFDHFGKGKNQYWQIQMALDISYQDKIIAEFREKSLIALSIGILLAIFLGFTIARRGIQRLQDLTETTRRITVSSLDHRIEPESWPEELRNLGIAFNQMLDRIESSFSRLTQFSSDLAHELRNPVNNLMGSTEVVLAQQHSIEEYQSVLESNLEELQRIAHTIEDLLFLARAENPQLDISKSLVQVEKEFQLLSEFYTVMAEEKNIELSFKGSATCYANPTMFRRLLSNLLSNALKYTPSGGHIIFEVTTLPNTQQIQMTIKDSGIGISKEHLPRIFNRFYRVDIARSQDPGGIGLGLAIVKAIVELHHGTITIVSELHEGTQVIIYLPI